MISPFIPLFSPFRGPPLKLYSFPLLLLHPFYILFIQLQLFPLSSTLLSFITHHTTFFPPHPFIPFLSISLFHITPSPLFPNTLSFIPLTPLIPHHLPLFHFSPSLYPISPLPSILHHPFSCTPHHYPLFHLTSLFHLSPSPYSKSPLPLYSTHSIPLHHVTPALYSTSPSSISFLFPTSLSPSAPARASQLTNKISNKKKHTHSKP